MNHMERKNHDLGLNPRTMQHLCMQMHRLSEVSARDSCFVIVVMVVAVVEGWRPDRRGGQTEE